MVFGGETARDQQRGPLANGPAREPPHREPGGDDDGADDLDLSTITAGDTLRVRVTHLKEEYQRRNGVFHSDEIEVTQYLIRRGNYLTFLVIAYDPVYLTEPLVKTNGFRLTNQVAIAPYPCKEVVEVPHEPGDVPHYLPGQNPYTTEFAQKHGLPVEATRGGADTALPEFGKKIRK